MEKKKYIAPVSELIYFDSCDVLTRSDGDSEGGWDEDWDNYYGTPT